MSDDRRLLDFGVGDGHIDGAGGGGKVERTSLDTLRRALDDASVTMPFVSQAQRQWMHIHHPEMAKRWEDHTPKGAHLPQHVTASDRAGDAALMVVGDGNGRFLSVSRDGNPKDIAFPGGHVEPGETNSDAAARELYEETGVTARIDGTSQILTAGAHDVQRTVHVFRTDAHNAHALPDFTPEPGETVRWALPSELCDAACTFGAFAREHYAALFGSPGVTMAAIPKVTVAVELIDAAKRKALDTDQFADPSERKYPIDTAARVRNAASRLEQQKGSMPAAKYKAIRGKIASAAKKFGIASEYNGPAKKKGAGGRVHVRADLAEGGALHVSHHTLSDKCGFAIVLGDEVSGEGFALKSGAEKLVWIQLAEVGAFRGHQMGAFELTPTTFSEIVANFNKDGLLVPIDYEHASEQPPTEGTIPINGAPAQGWIHKLDNRGSAGLWGLVEWLPQAREQIQAGAYKYISPAIRFASKDRVSGSPTGAKLTSAGITNSPFLKGLRPLAAKDGGAATTMAAYAYSSHEYMPKLKAAMRLSDLSTGDEMHAQLARLRAHFANMGGDVDAMSDGVKLADYMHPLRDIAAAGRMGATWDEVFDTVQSMINAAMGKHIVIDHGGQTNEDDDADEAAMSAMMQELAAYADLNDDEGDTAMTDVKVLEAKDSEITKLSLQLKERDTTIAANEAELVQLRAEKAKRDEAALANEVDVIVATFAQSKGLDDSDKPRLLKLLKADPATVREMYPLQAAQRQTPDNLRYLTERTVPPAPRVSSKAASQAAAGETPHEIFVFDDGTEVDARLLTEKVPQTTQRLMKEQEISYQTASEQAWKLHAELRGKTASR